MKKTITTIFIILIALHFNAQMKIGKNPSSINTSNNIEIEANNSMKVFVNKNDGRTYVENTPSALPTDSILFKAANGEIRQMSLSKFKQLMNTFTRLDTFKYNPSGWQTFIVPDGVSILYYDVFGSKGGGINGGNGGRVRGSMYVSPGQSLSLLVGKKGLYNGGAGGQNAANSSTNGFAGGDASIIATNTSATQASFLVVAGGGGGANGTSVVGGGAGGQNGGNGSYTNFQGFFEYGRGASQVASGDGGSSWDCPNVSSVYCGGNGINYVGGAGGSAQINTHSGGGGGGGGYFGGGGGAGGGTSVGAGGGGSSYCDPSFCFNFVYQTGVNTNDGYIVISY